MFNIDNFTFEALPENMDLPLVDLVEQAAADAAWEAYCAELFSTSLI